MRYAPGRLIVCEDSLAEASAALLALDRETIGRLVEIGGPPPLRRREPGFAGLAAIIVSQQVSVASANAIFGRLEAALAPLSAEAVLAAGEATLRACGLSGPKIRALTAVAQAVARAGPRSRRRSRDMPAADAHRALVAVKGIGPWTADIFLLFCIGHPDAFPAGRPRAAGGGEAGARTQDTARRARTGAHRRALAARIAASRRGCCGPITARPKRAPA